MAIVPKTKYPSQTNAADPAYPQGKAQNVTTPGDGTGTPFNADLVNDIWGWQQALLAAASITPSGDPDEVGASDYLAALQVLFPAESRMDTAEADIAALEAFQTSADGRLDDLEAITAEARLAAIEARVGSLVASNWVRNDTPGAGVGKCISNGSRWVLVESDKALETSDDGGNTFTARTVPGGWVATADGIDALWDGSQFIVLYVANGSGNYIATSPDGATWTDRSPAGTQGLRAVAWNGLTGGSARYVAVGYSGAIFSSTDGQTWTARTAAGGYAGAFWDVHFAAGQFVAVGTSGEIETSPDGITWTKRTPAASYSDDIRGIAYGNGYWTFIGDLGEVQTSPDAITWTQRAAAAWSTFTSGGLLYSDAFDVWLASAQAVYVSKDPTAASAWTKVVPFTGGVSSSLTGKPGDGGGHMFVGYASTDLLVSLRSIFG